MMLLLLLACVLPVMMKSVNVVNMDEVTDMEEQWTNWKKRFARSYSPEEELLRREIFYSKLVEIKEHNSKYPTHTSFLMGLNQFSDMTVEEYRDYNKLIKIPRDVTGDPDRSTSPPPLNSDNGLPWTVDWRKKGYVTPIKNQGQCGSCWAFSTTGSLEGQHFKKTGHLLSLSEQQLVDCSKENDGCSGGIMDRAFRYILHQPNGLETESDYPYTAENGTCKANASKEKSPIIGYQDVLPEFDEIALQNATALIGPISVAIDASLPSFQSYISGIYDEPGCSSYELDHGVLVVGYGHMFGQDYWLVKNSWGTSWGIQGYIMMSRNNNNQCGIATMPSYPIC